VRLMRSQPLTFTQNLSVLHEAQQVFENGSCSSPRAGVDAADVIDDDRHRRARASVPAMSAMKAPSI